MDIEKKTCSVCKKPFTRQDEVVVCPECGAYHHKSCYQELGHCYFFDRHEELKKESEQKVQSKPKQEETSSEQGNVCNRCGSINPEDGLFCKVCGNSLTGNTEKKDDFSNLFPAAISFSPYAGFSKDETFDGISVEEYARFIGPNTIYFLPRFQSFSKRRFLSFNFCAFLFPSIYFLFRKMIFLGIGYLLLDVASVITDVLLYFHATFLLFGNLNLEYVSAVLSIITMMLSTVSGIFANLLYYRKAKAAIRKAKAQSSDAASLQTAISKAGGVSAKIAALPVVLLFMLMMGITLLLTITM